MTTELEARFSAKTIKSRIPFKQRVDKQVGVKNPSDVGNQSDTFEGHSVVTTKDGQWASQYIIR